MELKKIMPETIQINFAHLFPLFPIAGVCLLPHATIPLHIFEPRYTKMVNDALDSAGQIALATFEGEQWKHEYHGNPQVRPIVCLSQIERHEKLPGGRYNILVQGICRARILEEVMPTGEIPYRQVKLEPLESNPDAHEAELAAWRTRMRELLDQDGMGRHKYQSKVLEWFERDDIPSHVLIEIVGHLLMTTVDDSERRYQLLSESDTLQRADFTEHQIQQLAHEITSAGGQISDWPKGMSWN